MRHHTTPLTFELNSEGGSKTISITPGANSQSGKFVISGITPSVDGMRTYMTKFWLHVQFEFDQAASGGAAVSWDKLAKVLQSTEVISNPLGQIYPHYHTQGPSLMHMIGVISGGYQYPEGAITQIGAGDGDTTVDLFFLIPIANDVLVDPMETAQWTGFFDSGTVEAILSAQNIFDGDSSGAVYKTPTTLRCLAEAMPSAREFLGVPFQWRRYQISGGGTSPVLKNVGGNSSLNNIAPGAGLAAMLWQSNATGIGLGGPDGVDNFTSITLDWRGQKNVRNLDGFFLWARAQQEKRTSPIANAAGAAIADLNNWPRTMDATGQNRPAADPNQMCLPIVVPGRQLHTAKTQRVLGDLQVDFTVTNAINNAHEFLNWELLEFTQDQANALAALGRFSGVPARKSITGKPGTASNFRYTAIEFVPPEVAAAGG